MLLFAAALSAAASLSNASQQADNGACPRTSASVAGAGGIGGSQRLRPRKLTELPPGTAYMAVYRHIGRCEAPLTMVDYRNSRRR